MVDYKDLAISPRVRRLLEKNGIYNVEAIEAHCRRELGDLKGIGKKSVDEIEEALQTRGLVLATDPWGPYTCARHNRSSWDTTLVPLYLCTECAGEFQHSAFGGKEPEYVGDALTGYCLHCNQRLGDVRLHQWFLCRICGRVVKSIGRSVVADAFLEDWWRQHAQPRLPHLVLKLTDPPELQPYSSSSRAEKVSKIDFAFADSRTDEEVFGIELKTGRNYVSGRSIGAKMTKFQLDNSDCDDILAVVGEKGLPVYLAHAQVIDRADAPTVHYAALGLWWTDMFTMSENFTGSRQRPRENRIAAYYKTAMFKEMGAFLKHVESGGPQQLQARMDSEGIPSLYY